MSRPCGDGAAADTESLLSSGGARSWEPAPGSVPLSRSAPAPPQTTQSAAYVEFHQDSVPCPSCKGLGRIAKADEAKLVALIPYSDKRLKPRRTTLYVVLSILATLALSAILIFFLIPRQISMSSHEPRINPHYTYVNAKDRVLILRFKTTFNVSNENYFDVKLGNVTMSAMHDKKMMKTEQLSDGVASSKVPLRDVGSLAVPMNVTFTGDYVALQCDMWFSEILLHFRVSAVASYLLHTEEISLDTYQMVNCSRTGNGTRPTAGW